MGLLEIGGQDGPSICPRPLRPYDRKTQKGPSYPPNPVELEFPHA